MDSKWTQTHSLEHGLRKSNKTTQMMPLMTNHVPPKKNSPHSPVTQRSFLKAVWTPPACFEWFRETTYSQEWANASSLQTTDDLIPKTQSGAVDSSRRSLCTREHIFGESELSLRAPKALTPQNITSQCPRRDDRPTQRNAPPNRPDRSSGCPSRLRATATDPRDAAVCAGLDAWCWLSG